MRVIGYIDWLVQESAGVVVNLFTTERDPLAEVKDEKPIIILHLQFKKWLQEKGYLKWERNTSDHTGNHQQLTGTIEYKEFLKQELKAKDLHEYLVDKKLTSLEYDPSLI